MASLKRAWPGCKIFVRLELGRFIGFAGRSGSDEQWFKKTGPKTHNGSAGGKNWGKITSGDNNNGNGRAKDVWFAGYYFFAGGVAVGRFTQFAAVLRGHENFVVNWRLGGFFTTGA